MDATRAAHDHVARELEQPQQAHLLDDVRRLGHHAHVVTTGDNDDDNDDRYATTNRQHVNETTPLVVKAGHQRVYIDDDVDLEKLDAQLRDEERAAIDADAHTPLRQLWKEEATHLVALSIPITLVLLLETLPGILVSMMIGNVSGAASPQVLAGSSLADFFQGQITTSIVNGLGAAVATMCAQSFGAQRYAQLWIYAQAGLLACLYCLPPLAVVCFNGATLLTLVGQEPPLAHVAGVLIVVSFASLPFLMIYTVARSALQAQNIAAPFVVVSVASYAISLPLGYYLGNHTSLGYVGIALSNIVSNALRALAVVPILWRNDVFVRAWPGWQWRHAHALVTRLWPIGGGSVLMTVFQNAGFFAIFVLCGYLPNAAVVMAANNIGAGLLGLAFMPMMAIGAAGTVRIGNALGAGQPRRATVASRVVAVETFVVSLVGLTLCWWVAQPYAEAFTLDTPTIALATELVRYLFVLVPPVGAAYATQAVFQACGAQWLCAKLNFVCLFALGVPLGVVFAVPLGQGVFGLWNGNLVGVTCVILIGFTWVSRIDWPAMAHDARRNAHLHVEPRTPREPSPEASMVTASIVSSP